MLRVLFLFLVLIASLVLGPMLAGHQGYVLIQTDNYNVETSVTGLVIMAVLLFLALFVIEWILRRVFRTGARTRGARVDRPQSDGARGLARLARGTPLISSKAPPTITPTARSIAPPTAGIASGAPVCQFAKSPFSATWKAPNTAMSK